MQSRIDERKHHSLHQYLSSWGGQQVRTMMRQKVILVLSVLSLKKDGISGISVTTQYFYRSNPLSQEGDLEQLKTAMWTNTFTGAGIGIG